MGRQRCHQERALGTEEACGEPHWAGGLVGPQRCHQERVLGTEEACRYPHWQAARVLSTNRVRHLGHGVGTQRASPPWASRWAMNKATCKTDGNFGYPANVGTQGRRWPSRLVSAVPDHRVPKVPYWRCTGIPSPSGGQYCTGLFGPYSTEVGRFSLHKRWYPRWALYRANRLSSCSHLNGQRCTSAFMPWTSPAGLPGL